MLRRLGVRWAEKPRLAKPERHVPSLSQMPPRGTVSSTPRVGHQAGSSQERRSPLERWWLWGLETLPSWVRLGGIRPRCSQGNGSRRGTRAGQELAEGEHLLQHRQAPVHHQRPGQRFGSLVADLIFCQAAREKKNGVVFRGGKRLSQPLACPRMSEQRRAMGGIWWMFCSLFSWGGCQAGGWKDRVEGEFLDSKILRVMKRELRSQHGGLYVQPQRRAGRWRKRGPICISLRGGQDPVPSVCQVLRAEPPVSSKQP